MYPSPRPAAPNVSEMFHPGHRGAGQHTAGPQGGGTLSPSLSLILVCCLRAKIFLHVDVLRNENYLRKQHGSFPLWYFRLVVEYVNKPLLFGLFSARLSVANSQEAKGLLAKQAGEKSKRKK